MEMDVKMVQHVQCVMDGNNNNIILCIIVHLNVRKVDVRKVHVHFIILRKKGGLLNRLL